MSERPREDERPSVGFRVMVTLAGLYLALRLVQGVAWVVSRIL